jgi:alpha-tubulin suppressor-like RCC1 family protein
VLTEVRRTTHGTDRAAVDIAAGADHAYARLGNGAAKCWGLNQFGKLGLGNINNRGDNQNEMGDNPGRGLGKLTRVSTLTGKENKDEY